MHQAHKVAGLRLLRVISEAGSEYKASICSARGMWQVCVFCCKSLSIAGVCCSLSTVICTYCRSSTVDRMFLVLSSLIIECVVVIGRLLLY
jgi:hypothetical protein